MEKAHCLETDPLPHQFSSSSPFPPFQAFGPFATSSLYPGSLESVLKYAQLFSFRKKKIVLNLCSTFYPLFLPFVHRDVLKLNRWLSFQSSTHSSTLPPSSSHRNPTEMGLATNELFMTRAIMHFSSLCHSFAVLYLIEQRKPQRIVKINTLSKELCHK